MANDLNSVNLVARLTRDPELRSLPSGTSVCELRVAFNTSKKVSDGNYEDVGNFIDVSVWGKQGEALARNLTKGQRIGIVGRLEHRTWKDNDGNNRERHSVVAMQVQYLDPKQDGSGSSSRSSAPVDSAPPVDDEDIPF